MPSFGHQQFGEILKADIKVVTVKQGLGIQRGTILEKLDSEGNYGARRACACEASKIYNSLSQCKGTLNNF